MLTFAARPARDDPALAKLALTALSEAGVGLGDRRLPASGPRWTERPLHAHADPVAPAPVEEQECWETSGGKAAVDQAASA